MAKLTGQTIASSYDQLLIVNDADGISSSLQAVESADTGGSVSALQISTVAACIDNPTASSATQGGKLVLQSDDGDVMASGHRLGVIEFSGAEDTSSTITVGARIEALCDATWSGTENGADLVFYTTDADATQSEGMRLTADAGTLFSKAVTTGVDDTGVDVRVYSATASEGLHYDASEDELGLLLTTKLKFHDIGGGEEIYASANGHLEVNSGTTLDITAPTVDINASTAVTIDAASTKIEGAGQCEFYRTSSATNSTSNVVNIRHVSDGDMADDFGTGVAFSATDSGATTVLGQMRFIRDGDDNEGRFVVLGRTNGAETVLDIPASGAFSIGSGLQFQEVAHQTTGIANDSFHTAFTASTGEDGWWIVYCTMEDASGADTRAIFYAYSTSSGNTRDSHNEIDSRMGRQWSGNNFQIKHTEGSTRTIQFSAYRFHTG